MCFVQFECKDMIKILHNEQNEGQNEQYLSLFNPTKKELIKRLMVLTFLTYGI